MTEIRLKSKDGIKQFLKTIVEVSSAEAMQNMDTAHATMRERERQQRVAQNTQAAVGDGARSSDKAKAEADDDLFADDGDSKEKPKKKSSDKGSEAKPKAEKKPEPSSDDGTDDSGGEEKRQEREPGLPKYMSHELPAAEDVTLDMVIDRLNVMRSGKSLKDENVAVEMQHYFDDLSSPERLTLLSLLTGLAEVITGGVSGEEAHDPEDAGVQTDAPQDKQHAPDAQHKEQPKPQKTQQPAVKKQGGGSEDVTPPIRVGGAQNTESIRRKMRTI